MGLEILPIGGFHEVGRNCIAVKVDDEVVILDMGLMMEEYVKLTSEEREDVKFQMSAKYLIEQHAAPDINILGDLKDKVKAILITHAHLDHVGAVPWLASKFKCPVHATHFTHEVLKTLVADDKVALKNEMVAHQMDAKFKISDKISAEFISVTHSIPETVIIAVHTPYGTVVYANDFKFDNAPTLGKKPNFTRLKQIAPVKVLILDSLYAHYVGKTPSESIAREMLRDVLLGTDSTGKAVIVTTFGSHIARLNSIIQIGQKLNRKIVFIGRSLAKYCEAAERMGFVPFSKQVQFGKYGSMARKFFEQLKKPEDHLLVVTGHQGEPNAILSRMVYQGLYKFREEDHVVFSCRVIPTPVNQENRAKLDAALKTKKVRLFTDVHVSGHAYREDHRELINLVKPEHVIPTHGEPFMLEALKALALEMNYKEDKIHLLHNGDRLKIS